MPLSNQSTPTYLPVLLAKVVAGAAVNNLAASWTGNYDFIEITFIASQDAATHATVDLQLNGKTDANYAYAYSVDGAASTKAGLSTATFIRIVAGASFIHSSGQIVCQRRPTNASLPRYKTNSNCGGIDASNSFVIVGAGDYNDTVPGYLTSCKLLFGANVEAGSQMLVYGYNVN